MLFESRQDRRGLRRAAVRSSPSSTRPLVLVRMSAVALSLAVVGCASPRPAAGAGEGRAGGVPLAAAAADGAADPLAPSVYQPVIRGDAAVVPTLSGPEGGFAPSRAVSYADGISVRVDRVNSEVERASGPGQFPGRPNAALHLTIRNDSNQPLALDAVVVTATYGDPPRLAAAVYEDSVAQDFSGSAAPGAAVSAVYVFAVPPEQRRSMAAFVDFDGVHAAAVFRGGVG